MVSYYYRILSALKEWLSIITVVSIILLPVSCEKDKDPYDIDPDDSRKVSISGLVFDSKGPVKDAVVRIQCTDSSIRTDSSGFFKIDGLNTDDTVKITAWAYGYYIAGGKEYPAGTDSVQFLLTPLLEGDNPDYQWLSSYSEDNNKSNCQNCHSGLDKSLPFDEWITHF